MIGVHDKKVSVVRGGATRQESVFNALKGVATEIVVIHDGARPTLHPDDVAALLSALGDREAVTLGTPARDTLVRAPSGVFTEVVPRDSVWQIFTPQGFRAATIRDAHEWARAYGAAFTDDFTLACLFTNKSRIIETRRFYLKVTYPEDEEVWRKFANPSE
jgi:2-C-methyl-D-erythritol 4-phosphate cytidylyltransferase